MNRVPTGAVECPKCHTKNTLRLRFYINADGLERMQGACSRCQYSRAYLPLDYEGSR